MRSACFSLWTALALAVSSCTRPPAESPPQSFPPAEPVRAVTWNLEWFPGHKPSAAPDVQLAHVAAVQSALPKLRPDILLLQEIRDQESVEKAVSTLPGFNVHIVSRFKEGAKLGLQQVAIASRFTADSAFYQEWHPSTASPPRGFSFAAIELSDKRLLLTYSVHLKSNAGPADDREKNIAKREESARQLAQHVADMEELYRSKGRQTAVLIAGDFNLLETQPGFEHEQTRPILQAKGFGWGWEGVAFSERITWPPDGRFAGACFDHFFTKNLGASTAKMLPIDGVSDHRPVELLIEGTAGPPRSTAGDTRLHSSLR